MRSGPKGYRNTITPRRLGHFSDEEGRRKAAKHLREALESGDGDEILVARKYLEMGRLEFAQILGVVKGTIQRWESGDFSPQDRSVEKIEGLVGKLKESVNQ